HTHPCGPSSPPTHVLLSAIIIGERPTVTGGRDVGGPLQTLFGNAPRAPIFYIGLADQFDGDKLKAYPPGSVIVLPNFEQTRDRTKQTHAGLAKSVETYGTHGACLTLSGSSQKYSVFICI